MQTEDKKHQLLQELSEQENMVLYEALHARYGQHPLEKVIGMSAEVLLQVISIVREQNGMTWRMLRGVIAEIIWGVTELVKLQQWKDNTPAGDLPFDYLVSDGRGDVRVQVKLQRSTAGKPMFYREVVKFCSGDYYCVETQKTRGGIDVSTGEQTRSYRFGEFDILAVSLQPSTGKWDDFIYTVADWLLPDEKYPLRINKYQPVDIQGSDYWTKDFNLVVYWLRQQEKKRLTYTPLF